MSAGSVCVHTRVCVCGYVIGSETRQRVCACVHVRVMSVGPAQGVVTQRPARPLSQSRVEEWRAPARLQSSCSVITVVNFSNRER